MRLAKLVKLHVCVCLFLLLLSSGCTRRFFRLRADREVAQILKEKDVYPFWKIENYNIYPNPRARFADPTNPDRPPKPLDDPAAWELSPDPQSHPKYRGGFEGTGYLELLRAWDLENQVRVLEKQGGPGNGPFVSPDDPLKGPPEIILTAQFSDPDKKSPEKKQVKGQGGSINKYKYKNRDQDKVTEIKQPDPIGPYLLNLGQAVELAVVNNRDFQTRREDLYLTALPVTFERFGFAAQFFATETLFREWSGSRRPEGKQNRWLANSDLGFSKVFSTGALLLFQFANRTVIDLTSNLPNRTTSQSFINLDFVQPFLRGGGRAVTLEPLTQVERDLLYEIRSYARFRKSFYVSIATGGDLDIFTVQPVRQGYLPTLLRFAELRIDEENVRALGFILDRYEQLLGGGSVTPLQVAEVRLDYLGAQNQVRSSRQAVNDSLDRFKIQLGIPVTLLLNLDESEIEPIQEQLERFEKLFAQTTGLENRIYDILSTKTDRRKRLEEYFTQNPLVKGTKFQREFPKRWQAIYPDQVSDVALKARIDQLKERLRGLIGKELTDEDRRNIRRWEAELELSEMELLLRRLEAGTLKRQEFEILVNLVIIVTQEAAQERLEGLRELWPELPRVIVEGKDLLKLNAQPALDVAVRTALNYRVDLMNVRGFEVDAWRQIRVAANALMGVFNVEYHLESTTPPDRGRPFAFSGSRTRHQLVLDGELPLTRKLERNDYRRAQIFYQRARRFRMAFEDGIAATVRRELRQLRVLAANFEVQKEQVELAYQQRDNAFEALIQPIDPNSNQDVATRAAALTNQLLGAQRSVVGVQNTIYRTWINYLITRLQLYRDLELIFLDNRGIIIDEYADNEITAASDRNDRDSVTGNDSDAAVEFLPPAEFLPRQVPAP